MVLNRSLVAQLQNMVANENINHTKPKFGCAVAEFGHKL